MAIRDSPQVASEHGLLQNQNRTIEKGRLYWKQEAIESRAQVKTLKQQCVDWKQEALKLRKEKQAWAKTLNAALLIQERNLTQEIRANEAAYYKEKKEVQKKEKENKALKWTKSQLVRKLYGWDMWCYDDTSYAPAFESPN